MRRKTRIVSVENGERRRRDKVGHLKSKKFSKKVEECLRYELKPINTGHRRNTTRSLNGKMFLFLWLL